MRSPHETVHVCLNPARCHDQRAVGFDIPTDPFQVARQNACAHCLTKGSLRDACHRISTRDGRPSDIAKSGTLCQAAVFRDAAFDVSSEAKLHLKRIRNKNDIVEGGHIQYLGLWLSYWSSQSASDTERRRMQDLMKRKKRVMPSLP